MGALQHIVADLASPKCNILSLSDDFPLRHNGAMVENTPKPEKPRPNLLHAWRTHRGLSQVELAERVGTSHQVIGYLERGRTELSAKWLLKLADALDTTPGHLLSVDPANLDNDIVDIWSRIPERERANALKAIRGFADKTGTND